MVEVSSPGASPGMRQAVVGLGAGAEGFATGALHTAEMTLNVGPQHPSTHGVLRLALTLDGERIVRSAPVVGYMHRGAEKLFEVRDYRQIVVLSHRRDWLSAFSNELGGRRRSCSAWLGRCGRSGPVPCWPSSTGCSTT